MKKITIQCQFGEKKAPFDVYIGNPKPGHHPLEFQSQWLKEHLGGEIPEEVMDKYSKLLELANRHGDSFEDLCVYASEAVNEKKSKSIDKLQIKTDLLEKSNIIVDKTLILAEPKDLNPYFDEEFYLLQFPLKTGLVNDFYIIFLIKEKNLEKFKIGYPYSTIDGNKLSAMGRVEWTVKEMDIAEIYGLISIKYGIELEKIEANKKIELK